MLHKELTMILINFSHYIQYTVLQFQSHIFYYSIWYIFYYTPSGKYLSTGKLIISHADCPSDNMSNGHKLNCQLCIPSERSEMWFVNRNMMANIAHQSQSTASLTIHIFQQTPLHNLVHMFYSCGIYVENSMFLFKV